MIEFHETQRGSIFYASTIVMMFSMGRNTYIGVQLYETRGEISLISQRICSAIFLRKKTETGMGSSLVGVRTILCSGFRHVWQFFCSAMNVRLSRHKRKLEWMGYRFSRIFLLGETLTMVQGHRFNGEVAKEESAMKNEFPGIRRKVCNFANRSRRMGKDCAPSQQDLTEYDNQNIYGW